MNASSLTTNTTANNFIELVVNQIISPALTVLVLAAFVIFIWGVVQYIRYGDDQTKRTQGQDLIIWGIVGFVIIFGSAAIVSILRNIVGII